MSLLFIPWRISFSERFEKYPLELLNLLDSHCSPVFFVENIQFIGFRPELVDSAVANVSYVSDRVGQCGICSKEKSN